MMSEADFGLNSLRTSTASPAIMRPSRVGRYSFLRGCCALSMMPVWSRTAHKSMRWSYLAQDVILGCYHSQENSCVIMDTARLR